MSRLRPLAAAAAVLVAASVAPLLAGTGAAPVRAQDQGDGPLARALPQLDIGDLYVFASPENPARTILLLTVSPFAGSIGSTDFATKATYNLLVDTNGDFVEDDVHSLTFGKPAKDGRQSLTLSHRGRGAKYKAKGYVGTPFTANNGTRVACGVYDDPAFFDLLGQRRGNAYSPATSSNFFEGVNALAIVLDVANGEFGPNQGLRVWATTAQGRKQVDRVGRPGLGLFLVAPSARDAWNAGRPKDDQKNFMPDLVQRLATLRHGNYTGVNELLAVLLPDVLPFTPGDTRGFADGNGRKLDDDVVDFTLALLTNNATTTDHVANDSTFGATFPYLAPANP